MDGLLKDKGFLTVEVSAARGIRACLEAQEILADNLKFRTTAPLASRSGTRAPFSHDFRRNALAGNRGDGADFNDGATVRSNVIVGNCGRGFGLLSVG